MDAYIYDAVRTPRGRGKSNGSLHELTSVRLSAFIIDALIERNAIGNDTIEDLIWGNVTQIGEQGGCLARAAVLMSTLNDDVPGLSINRFCASGLEAVNLAANQIREGVPCGYIAGGVEMMSRVPMGSDGAAIMVDPDLAMTHYLVPQGISADIIATEYGFTREDCDAYAVNSHARATNAWNEGRFEPSVVPVTDRIGIILLTKDEQIRANTSMSALAELPVSFADIGESVPGFDRVALMKYPHLERICHVHHAGNSSGIVDGSAAILVGNQSFGKRNGLKPRARILSTSKIGSDPTIMLTGPIPASQIALDKAGMSINDIDLIEVNEAFASVPLRFMQAFNIHDSRINVNGGSIAMGHPLGATGAMLLGTILDELERSGKSTALVTLCVAAGMGAATVIERL